MPNTVADRPSSQRGDAITVAVAVISDVQGRVLLTRRSVNVHQGGLWEFPGGKVDPGETVSEGLVRECREELGIAVRSARPLICVHHDYGDRRVVLDVHLVTGFDGEPHGAEGQPMAWVSPDDLGGYPLPAANRPIVNAIRLPAQYLITPSLIDDRFVYLEQLQASLERGVRLVQFRVASGSDPRRQLAEHTARLCHAVGAQLLVNGDAALARAIGADGVHVKSRQLHQLRARPEGLRWVAGSCHDGDDLARLAELGGDFAVLSPVKATASHPETRPLGWAAFGELARGATVPVFALGGLDSTDLRDAWRFGAQGIAAITGLWGRG